ncbi:unnamed protein product [Calypogeia fissa]
MATRTFTKSLLALMAILAVFAVNSPTAMGQSQGASFHIVNDGSLASILGTGVTVHCYDTSGPNNLNPAFLIPGQSLYFTWPFISILEDVYKCDFNLDTDTGPLRQSFVVWKQDQGNFSWYLNGCQDCKWSIVVDGFYWYDNFQQKWVKEYSWIQG